MLGIVDSCRKYQGDTLRSVCMRYEAYVYRMSRLVFLLIIPKFKTGFQFGRRS